MSCSLRLHCCLLALYLSADGHSELSLCSRRSSVSPILQNLQQKSEKSVQTATMRRRHKTQRGTSFTEQGTSLSLPAHLSLSLSLSFRYGKVKIHSWKIHFCQLSARDEWQHQANQDPLLLLVGSTERNSVQFAVILRPLLKYPERPPARSMHLFLSLSLSLSNCEAQGKR